MKITATPIKGKDLKPGQLFSTLGQDYWDKVLEDNITVGERVFIRTNAPVPEGEGDAELFLITIPPALKLLTPR